MPAFYRRPLRDFLADPDDQIVGRLTAGASQAGFYMQIHAQTAAWQASVALLNAGVARLLDEFDSTNWQLLLEYPIPRRGKRIDAVLIAGGVLIVIEFKCGATAYGRDAIAQVEDYCLDLSDFHKASLGCPIVPFVVATQARDHATPVENDSEPVKPTWLANADDLALKLIECIARYTPQAGEPIDPSRWDESDYVPTPTIIEAARSLYAGQNVREIARCHAGVENLSLTTDTVIRAVEEARTAHRKRICFITGVPGAGKTLAGLNIVHNGGLHAGDLGVFLSGNGPLVRVLTEALSRDAAVRLKQSRLESRRSVETFIQNVHHFIDDYFGDASRVPIDKVIIFDEAQRAWDAAQSMRKFQRPHSEPEILLEIMDRHPDWSVIVALIGGGQEINRGEVGLAEWGRAITTRFRHWDVLISPELKAGTHATGACLFPEAPDGISIAEEPSLHLRVNILSYKAEWLSDFVDAILRLEPDRARTLKARVGDFPLALTRDLTRVRE